MNSSDRLDPNFDKSVAEAWRKEIERRVEELDCGTAKTVLWETVLAELLRRVDTSATD